MVGGLIDEFEARTRHRGRRAADAVDRPHEKLLTATHADELPDIFKLGNTWVPEFAMLARWSRCNRASTLRARWKQADYFPASGTPT